ncbi:tyrosine-type recombinase/integrase [Weissella paramesenteroides]|uniref:tyrosine-type recombinase/integrase n=1 Tax=Weissella paramesenteroides TaxID=1249 RepID=UPI003F268C48
MASITKRGKKWRARASYVDARGVRQQPSKTFDTKKAATEWATRLENQIFDGSDINAGKMLFPDYFREWVETNKKDNVRESTYINYNSAINIIDDLFENIPMDKLTTMLIQKKINEFGKTRSTSYVGNLVTKIKNSLRDAYIDEIINRDVFSRIKVNGQDIDRGENFLNATDFIKLQTYLYSKEEIMKDNPFYLMVLIALETGMRIGEIQALTNSDIGNGKIKINKSYSTASHTASKPKTKSSIRNVLISNRLEKLIYNYFDEVKRPELVAKKYYSKSTAHYMKKITHDAGVPLIRFHGLRHSHVSYLLYNDVDMQYVSKRVGHASTRVTMNFYAHMLKEKEQAQDKLTLSILNSSDQ